MNNHLLPSLLLFLLWLGLGGAAWAGAPPMTGRPLGEILNADGTLRAGANGSFDARAFRMGTAPDGQPVFRPAGTKGAGDARWADGFGLPDGTNGSVETVVRSGADIYIGGYFTAVGRVAANCVAKWDGTAWSALGQGLGSSSNLYYVEALAVAANGDVYAGGYFDQAGGASANYVARWNGTVWSSLGGSTVNGVNGIVYALAVASNGDVYAGGSFTQAGGAAASRVARWNGTGWNSLGSGAANGVNNTVYALAAGNGGVYVGGYFDHAGGMPMLSVAQWDGATWNPLDSGISLGVVALAVAANGDLYAGGYFNRAGSVSAGRIARWDGTRWNALGAGLNNTVYALAVAGNGDVYAGGDFGQAGSVSASGLARWNGTAWSALGLGVAGVSGQIHIVSAVAVAGNGEVFAGGGFSQVAGATYFGIASWNGSNWNRPGAGPGLGVSGTIEALAVAGNGDVYAAGSFLRAGGTMARNVARWNGTAWASLGTGTANGIDLPVHTLAVAGNGDVYVGGYFRTAGGVPALNVAKWDGNRWSALGTGLTNPLNNAVLFALAVAPNGDVYAGGSFTEAGGTAANNVARWNGTTWSALGAGATNGVSNTTNNASVMALTMAGNDLYVGGQFAQAGGVAANNVARWNGTGWSPLGISASNGVQGYVAALAVAANGDVYTGGGFTQAGGIAANNVAKWNGTAWSPLGA
jgi:hypothetical protein